MKSAGRYGGLVAPMLHDVDLALARPRIPTHFWQQPNGGPSTSGARKLRTHFPPAVLLGPLAFDLARRVTLVAEVGVVGREYEVVAGDRDARWVIRLLFVVVRRGPENWIPLGGIECRAGEFVIPNKGPT